LAPFEGRLSDGGGKVVVLEIKVAILGNGVGVWEGGVFGVARHNLKV